MFMIVCVIQNPDQLDTVLSAWQAIGINGVTILESSGLYRYQERKRIPMRYGFASGNTEKGSVTLISVVEQEVMIQRCLEATESVLGDLDNPNTGVFFVTPVVQAKGITGKRPFIPNS